MNWSWEAFIVGMVIGCVIGPLISMWSGWK